MNTRMEIAEVQQRIAVLEADLQQLKRRVSVLETDAAEEPAAALEPPAADLARVELSSMAAPDPLLPTEMEQPLRVPLRLSEPPLGPDIGATQSPSTDADADVSPDSERLPDLPQVNPLREWLEPLQLWPPRGEANAEVRLAAWWTTRIGALLAVIGVVFLGIYVSRNAAPWVRLTEVGMATAGVLWLGSWLERRIPKFGAVVFGAGLALAYFTAFGAYAVGPMKVIVSPATAMACELFAVAAILATAWWRGSPVVATMAVALGHVTAFLALRGETAGFGPWVVLLLGIAAVVLRLVRAWSAPSLLALPLAWVFLFATGATQLRVGLPLGALWIWGILYFILHSLRDWAPAWREETLSTFDRGVQVVNSSLAVAVGLFLTDSVQLDGKWEQFFLGSGVILLLAAVAWRATKAGRELVPVLTCKGSGLIALGLIALFDGHARYLVLLAQAFAMLVAAQRSTMQSLRVATVIVGVVAGLFYVLEVTGIVRPWTPPMLTELVFLAGAVAFAGALRRLLAIERNQQTAVAVMLGGLGVLTLCHWTTGGWSPALAVIVGVALFAGGAVVRAWWMATLSAAVLCVVAHQQLWVYPLRAYSVSGLWVNESVLLAVAVLATLGARTLHEAGQRRLVHGVIAGLATSTFVIAGFHAWPAEQAVLVAMVVGVAMMALSTRCREWPLAGLSTIILALGACRLAIALTRSFDRSMLLPISLLAWVPPVWLALSSSRRDSMLQGWLRDYTPALQTALATLVAGLAIGFIRDDTVRVVVSGAASALAFALAWRCRLRPALEASWVFGWIALVQARGEPLGLLVTAVAFAPAIVMTRWSGPRGEWATPFWRRHAAGIQVALAGILGWTTAQGFDGVARISGLAVVIALAYATWRWGRVAAARHGVLALTVAGLAAAAEIAGRTDVRSWNWPLTAALAIAGWAAVAPVALAREWDATALRWTRWVGSAAGMALAIFALTEQSGEVAWYATAGCGLFAVSLFVVGLFARSRPHRLVGLGGLAFCVARAFLVDIDSTLYRIVAFVVLGVVLLWVGFSYHRFRHLIEEEAK